MAESKLIAPRIKPVYSTFAEMGGEKIRVYGHESRCKALLCYWNERYEIDPLLPEIGLVDIAPDWFGRKSIVGESEISRDAFRVEITDAQSSSSYPFPHLIINYQVGAENWFRNDLDDTQTLLGKEFFFFEEAALGASGDSRSDRPSVVAIPNGNQPKFFERFNVGDAYQVVQEQLGGCLTVVNHLDKKSLLDHLAMASVVVTTPSVTSMECLSFGLPVLLIQTSRDQTGELAETGLAYPYSPEVLGFLLRNKAARVAMAMNGRENVRNNIAKVADKILAAYTEWYTEGTGMKDYE